MATSFFSVLLTRVMRRHRYVADIGWVVSQDTFMCHVQPEVKKSLPLAEAMNPFQNVTVFRENLNPINTYIGTNYTFPTQVEVAIDAQTGTNLAIGDRLVENVSGYMLMVRSISDYRDSMLQHDEIICTEASHMDKRWIEPMLLLSENGDPPTGMFYDPIRHQYVKLEANDQNQVPVFGVVEAYDAMERYERDIKVTAHTPVGHELNDRLLVHMDADFAPTEHMHLLMRGKNWDIEYIREGLTRVLIMGVNVYKGKGVGGEQSRIKNERPIIV